MPSSTAYHNSTEFCIFHYPVSDISFLVTHTHHHQQKSPTHITISRKSPAHITISRKSPAHITISRKLVVPSYVPSPLHLARRGDIHHTKLYCFVRQLLDFELLQDKVRAVIIFLS